MVTSRPATSAWPLSGRSAVDRMLTVVVLPDPFGPSRPVMLPGGTAQAERIQGDHLPVALAQVTDHNRRILVAVHLGLPPAFLEEP